MHDQETGAFDAAGEGPPVPPAEPPRSGAGASPGWYPDPWATGYQRYWDGDAWTAHSFQEGVQARADRAARGGPPAPVLAGEATPPPPEWALPKSEPEPAAPPAADVGLPPTRSWWPPRGPALLTLLVVGAFIVGLVGSQLPPLKSSGAPASAVRTIPVPPPPTTPPPPTLPPTNTTPTTVPGPSATTTPPATMVPSRPSTTIPGSTATTRPPTSVPRPGAPSAPSSADPSASALTGLVLHQSDVTTAYTVGTIDGGDTVAGGPTLDLCNGTFASEARRTARLQVAAADAQGSAALSTEAVLYATPAATAQAFSELESVAAACPATPVVSPVNEPTVTTHLSAAPDTTWPQVATVDRLAYDITSVDQSGQSLRSVAVYLRRGRVLMGVYLAQTGAALPAVDGQTSAAGIANLFAARLAQLPATVVNGG